ncbi:MAG: MoaD/ThiS family protein [Betaproteobacteria bacterium]
MRVLIPNPLLSYTGQAREVEADGATLDQLTHDLDRRYPGIRFRIIDEHQRVRRHIKLFVNRDQADDNLATPLKAGDEIMIVAALSGG